MVVFDSRIFIFFFTMKEVKMHLSILGTFE